MLICSFYIKKSIYVSENFAISRLLSCFHLLIILELLGNSKATFIFKLSGDPVSFYSLLWISQYIHCCYGICMCKYSNIHRDLILGAHPCKRHSMTKFFDFYACIHYMEKFKMQEDVLGSLSSFLLFKESEGLHLERKFSWVEKF